MIARQDEEAPFIAKRDELAEQVGALSINREIIDLIEDQEMRLCAALEFLIQLNLSKCHA